MSETDKHFKRPTAPEPAEYVAPKGIEAIAQDMCIDAGDDYVTVTIGADPTIKRQDGSPSEDGDVLSMQPNGDIQARPEGSRGAYELAKIVGPWIVYRPVVGGRCRLVPLATDWPNV